MQKQDPRTEKIPLKIKLFFDLSSLGFLTILSSYASLLTIVYQDVLDLSTRWIGIASLVEAVWNAINDPISGYLSDSTRSRLDRQEGDFFGVSDLLTQQAQSLANFLTVWILEISSFITRDQNLHQEKRMCA